MRLIESALSGPDTSGVVISGPAGVGKSRVAAEALAAAAARGFEVRWVAGTSAARGVPLGAMAAWADPAGSHGLQLLCGVIESLTESSTGASVIVGVDDVHLLDDMSIFVLHQIVQRHTARLLLTLRDGEAVPGGVTELWRLGLFDWLELAPLSHDDTAALLALSLDGLLDADAATRLYQLTHGNVLYLRHIVEQEVADGRLESRNGHWYWSGGPDVPHTLVELIEARVGALQSEVATVVDVLTIGEPLELPALQRITDLRSVEEAEVLGLIKLEQVGEKIEVRLVHPLYGEVRRNRAPVTRLRRLRGLVATELAAADDCDDVRILVRRAALTLDSDLTPDGDLLVRAAHGAVCLADLPLASRLAEVAARAGAGPQAQFIRAHAQSWLGHGETAEQVLAELDPTRLTEDEFVRFTFFRASNMLWTLGEPQRSKEIIDDASHLTTEPARRSLDAIRAVHWFATDRPDAALATAEGLDLGELPPVVGAETAWVLTNIHGDAGRTSAAECTAEAGYAIVRSSDAPQMRFNIADARVGAMLLAGRVRDAVDLAECERRQAADLPGAAHLLGIAIAGRAALGAGHLEEADALLEQASSALSASGHAIGWGYRYCIPRVVALAIRGEIDEAATLLASLDELHRPFRLLSFEVGLARAWVAAGQGAVSEGIGVLGRAAETAAVHGQFAAEVVCLQTATQFGDRSRGPRLRALESVVEGPRVGIAARFADALGDGDPAELAAVSEAYEALGDRVAAADAAAHAAIAYRRDNLRGSALGCAVRADDLAARCGGLRTAALAAAGSDLPLTEREREVVALLGQGLPNRDIAARLVLSVRTVEGHIYKAMAKTGVDSREELGSLVNPRKHPDD